MATEYIPSREAELVPYGLDFKTKITATPTVYGLTAGQATTFGGLYDAFVTAYNITQSDATRTPGAIITKDAAKKSMIANLRQLAGVVQKFPGTTNTMRSDLGLTVQHVRTPIPPPATSPVLEFKGVSGSRVTITLHPSTGTRRGKPAGVAGAAVFSYVGATPPSEISAWKFEGNTTRTLIDLEFGGGVPAFSRVWLTAFWFNPRGFSGVACTPVSTNLGSWVVESAENGEAVKIAA